VTSIALQQPELKQAVEAGKLAAIRCEKREPPWYRSKITAATYALNRAWLQGYDSGAFERGIADRRLGTGMSKNPYDKPSQREQWLAGWTTERARTRAEYRARKQTTKLKEGPASPSLFVILSGRRDPLSVIPSIKHKVKTRSSNADAAVGLTIANDWRRLQYVTSRGIG
jgi:ribosome modulation factor